MTEGYVLVYNLVDLLLFKSDYEGRNGLAHATVYATRAQAERACGRWTRVLSLEEARALVTLAAL